MKSRIASLGVAALLTAGMVLTPGAAMASTDSASTTTAGTTTTAPVAGGVASTYGMWFLPCDLGFVKWC